MESIKIVSLYILGHTGPSYNCWLCHTRFHHSPVHILFRLAQSSRSHNESLRRGRWRFWHELVGGQKFTSGLLYCWGCGTIPAHPSQGYSLVQYIIISYTYIKKIQKFIFGKILGRWVFRKSCLIPWPPGSSEELCPLPVYMMLKFPTLANKLENHQWMAQMWFR